MLGIARVNTRQTCYYVNHFHFGETWFTGPHATNRKDHKPEIKCMIRSGPVDLAEIDACVCILLVKPIKSTWPVMSRQSRASVAHIPTCL